MENAVSRVQVWEKTCALVGQKWKFLLTGKKNNKKKNKNKKQGANARLTAQIKETKITKVFWTSVQAKIHVF